MTDHTSIVISHLSSFRPSDRDALSRFMNDPAHHEATVQAIQTFIEEWEKADWLEAYSIERIGKWIGKTQHADAVHTLQRWSAADKTEARMALATGLHRGERDKHSHFA